MGSLFILNLFSETLENWHFDNYNLDHNHFLKIYKPNFKSSSLGAPGCLHLFHHRACSSRGPAFPWLNTPLFLHESVVSILWFTTPQCLATISSASEFTESSLIPWIFFLWIFLFYCIVIFGFYPLSLPIAVR